ncbi:MAG TPA: hypothetical protein PK788_11175, partial [Gemmatimonadaceae bacterium]|nr:hypothetical protein [Gemmatimonadaceae bacterium]
MQPRASRRCWRKWARAFSTRIPAAILHVGIAGARRASALEPAQLVIGSVARYTDLEVPAKFAPQEVAPDARLLDAARRALPEARVLPIATVARVGASV